MKSSLCRERNGRIFTPCVFKVQFFFNFPNIAGSTTHTKDAPAMWVILFFARRVNTRKPSKNLMSAVVRYLRLREKTPCFQNDWALLMVCNWSLSVRCIFSHLRQMPPRIFDNPQTIMLIYLICFASRCGKICFLGKTELIIILWPHCSSYQ